MRRPKDLLKTLWNSEAMAQVVRAHLEESLKIFRETGVGEDDYDQVVIALRRVIRYYGGQPE